MPEKPDPRVNFDVDSRKWSVDCPLMDAQGNRFQAEWTQDTVTILRVRKVGTSEWGPGFVTPFNSLSLVDLEPCTEYEVELRHRNSAGDGPSLVKKVATKCDEHGNAVLHELADETYFRNNFHNYTPGAFSGAKDS